jgi:hypothetical protein
MDNEGRTPISEGIGNRPYTTLTTENIAAAFHDLLYADEDISKPEKPKRKYTKKPKPVIDDTLEAKFNKELDAISTRIKRRMGGMARTRLTRKMVEEYLTCVIKHLEPNKKFKLFIEESQGSYNFVNYTINILINENGIDQSYGDYSVQFKLEELHSNCSSVGIHHFTQCFVNKYRDTYLLFKDNETFNKFLDKVVELCTMFGYSNILYTLSRESVQSFKEFVEAKAKLILEFKSKRTNNQIKYYSQLI